MQLRIKVKPASKIDALEKTADGSLLVRIKAPPVDGKANAYLEKFIASLLGIAKSKVQLQKGQTSKFKTLIIDESEEFVNEKLGNI